MKKRAFTLVEILICLTVIGVLAVILISNLKIDRFNEKSLIAQGHKVMQSYDQASIKIREVETKKCPLASFIAQAPGENSLGLVGADGEMTLDEVYNLYGNYIKYVNPSKLSFCNNTTYCTTASLDDKTIAGAKLPTGAYVGIQLMKIDTCPDYYIPGENTIKKSSELCWAKLYVDANGKEEPNQLGKDIFIFGIGDQGVVH